MHNIFRTKKSNIMKKAYELSTLTGTQVHVHVNVHTDNFLKVSLTAPNVHTPVILLNLHVVYLINFTVFILLKEFI